MTSLESLQALTYSELIERLATEVMGWEPRTDEWEKIVWNNWKPLTDWNHTMQVAEMVEEKTGSWMQVTKLKGKPTARFWISHSEWFEATGKTKQQAICLAALLSL